MLVTPITNVTPDGCNVSLTLGRSYEVLGIEADDYRVLTDEDTPHCPNDPVLYEPTCFQVLDSTDPAFWLSKCGADGERYAYPSDWMRVGFFEDFHDGVAEVRTQFWGTLRTLYPRTWAKRHGTAGWGR